MRVLLDLGPRNMPWDEHIWLYFHDTSDLYAIVVNKNRHGAQFSDISVFCYLTLCPLLFDWLNIYHLVKSDISYHMDMFLLGYKCCGKFVRINSFNVVSGIYGPKYSHQTLPFDLGLGRFIRCY